MLRRSKFILVSLLVIISFSVQAEVGYTSSETSNVSRGGGDHQEKYIFTTDWFSGTIPVWEEILRDYKGKPNIHYLEIGVFEGRSFFWMLDNILTHPASTATGIDPLFEDVKKTLLGNLEISGARDRLKIIRGFSQIELKKIPMDSFDIIYIDGDHHSSAVLTDAILSWPLLKKGGILIFDDYNLTCENVNYCSPDDKPKDAIDNFVSRHSNYIDIVHVGKQFMIRKKDYFHWEKAKLF